MTLNKKQLLAIAAAVVLFLILLLGFETKPPKLKKQEQERALNRQVTSIDILRKEALAGLESSQRSSLQIAQGAVESATDEDERTKALMALSRKWFELGQYALAGSAAEEIAEIKEDAESWGITGTTYGIGVSRSNVTKEKEYCRDKALDALDRAISFDPDEIDFQLNKAIILAEYPIKENPMKGILILLDLNKKFPKNVPVMNNLAKFALQTGQTDKALARLNTAIEIEPNNRTSNCMLAELYSNNGNSEMATKFRKRCEELK